MEKSKMDVSKYIMPFGKYNGFKAVDVAEMYKVNPKTGLEEAVGLKYLHFLVEKCDWFRDTEIIKKVIEMAEANMSDADSESEKQPKQEPKKKKEQKEVFHKKGEPKPEPKNKVTKAMNPFVLSSDDE